MSKVAVITGASRGFGLTLAREFAANGWKVIGTGRSERPSDFPEDGTYEQFDASDAAACADFWKSLQNSDPGTTLCLVNNAGGYVSGGLLEVKLEDYESQMKSCYFSSVYMTRGLVSVAAQARVINVISTSALAAHKNNSAYGAAKAAEMHFFQAVQQEFTPQQYRITNLYPSSIASQGPDPHAIQPADLAAFVRAQAELTTSYYLRDVTLYPAQ